MHPYCACTVCRFQKRSTPRNWVLPLLFGVKKIKNILFSPRKWDIIFKQSLGHPSLISTMFIAESWKPRAVGSYNYGFKGALKFLGKQKKLDWIYFFLRGSSCHPWLQLRSAPVCVDVHEAHTCTLACLKELNMHLILLPHY